MQSIKSLEAMGLSEPEAAIYLFLVQNGPSSAPQIQTALDLLKVPAYRALHSLSARNLVTTSGDKRLQKYTAAALDKLLKQYDHDIAQLQSAKEQMQTFMHSLANQQNDFYKERKIQVFEGDDGFKLWLSERMRGDVKTIRQFGFNRFWEDFDISPKEGDTKAIQYRQKRAKKGIELRSIFTSRPDIPAYARTDPDTLQLTRFLDMPSIPTVNLSIFGTRVGFYSSDGATKRGVVIDDKMLTSLLTIIFDVLWEQSKPV